MKYYLSSAEETLKELNSSKEGLYVEEAKRRIEKYGENKLKEAKKTSLFKRFLKQIADPMIIVLLGAAVLSLITSIYSNESFTDVFIILFVVILNSVLGVVQESKAEQAIDALKNMTAAQSKVLRNGKAEIIKSSELVVGDIILIEAGDSIPADARIIECASLKIEESALTGESLAVEKTASVLKESGTEIALGDRKNMVYMGSTAVYGRGTAVVCETGMETEMGKIAGALSDAKEEKTPLQVKLASLSKILTWIVLVICVAIFVIGVIKAGSFNLNVVLDTFMLAVSLAVAAIPEGLAAVVTIVLSIGVTKMSKRNAVIRHLTAVETLGCAQIICSDKTGTLTQNKMTVVDSFSENKEILIKAMALCCDAEVDTKTSEVIGEPTEAALVEYAFKENFDKNHLKKEYERIGEIPFDSERKMMTTIHHHENEIIQFTKGAPDEIISRCSHILTKNGIEEFTDTLKNQVRNENKKMADKALRVLAAAYVEHRDKPFEITSEKIEKDMIFVGLCGMIDPIRPEVKKAVKECHNAGITVIMITGDHIDTAAAIARELDILEDNSQAIMGASLNDMTDEELEKNIDKYRVYARVHPEHKVRIVNAWKKKGMVTAMTGDGVNDAPSIKSADIGIGMGITGTDVTKNVADMILADDNFATIVASVEEGRKIYANIQKTIQFLLSSNLSEVVGIFTATMLGFTLLKPAHMLWINLITDSLPALALGMEHGEEDSMKKKPRNSKSGIFADGMGFDILYQGLFVAFLTVFAYLVGHYLEAGKFELVNSPDGMTMAFLTLSMAEIFQSFNMRSRDKSIFSIKKQNIWLWGSALCALILTTAVIYIPSLAKAFGFTVISLKEYLIALLISILIIPLVELVKLIKRIIKKD